ncbi:MAG: hypothetical protein H7328_03575 [Bdellovibrio sp.]|nr:hypothetical protein [Bdellovibrio sp.]
MTRKVFFGTIAFGLVLNIWSDLSVYQVNKIGIGTGEWVNHSYQALQEIDAIKLQVIQSQLEKKAVPNIHSTIQNLGALVSDIPSQKSRASLLAELPDHQFIELGQNKALQILAELNSAGKSLLEERLYHDQEISAEITQRSIFANIVDLFLIFAALALFLYEKKLATRLQKALTSSLAHVESVNQRLQNTLFKRNSKFKIAVHDLKNPLGSIKGFAELLQDEAGNNKSILEMTQIIQRISNNTLSLVGSVLDNDNDNDSDLIPKEEVKVLDCLEETCAFLEPVARNKTQKIQIENGFCDFTFLGSRQKIQDIFYNLIGNALKFSPTGSSVSVGCFDDGNFHAIQISDQGPGFTKNDFSKMFQPGAKLSAKPGAGESSTGIGLYSAKQAMDSFNGTIEVTNNSDRGACITIRFPTNEFEDVRKKSAKRIVELNH